MLRSQRLIPACAIATITALALLSLNCGSSSSTHTLSTAQAQAVSQELFTALGNALSSGFTGVAAATHPRLPEIMRAVHPEQTSSDCTITNSGESCNIPISYTGNCPNGGTIAVAGDFIFTLNNSGDGSDDSTLTITPTNCDVSNTTINGNPNVTVTTQFSMQNDALAYPLTFTESGGISFGPNPSGSCTLNVNLSVTSATTCTVTGTICGQSLNGSC
jgi:hypothetical protein